MKDSPEKVGVKVVGGAESGALPASDSMLSSVLAAWPNLTPKARRRVVGLVEDLAAEASRRTP